MGRSHTSLRFDLSRAAWNAGQHMEGSEPLPVVDIVKAHSALSSSPMVGTSMSTRYSPSPWSTTTGRSPVSDRTRAAEALASASSTLPAQGLVLQGAPEDRQDPVKGGLAGHVNTSVARNLGHVTRRMSIVKNLSTEAGGAEVSHFSVVGLNPWVALRRLDHGPASRAPE